MTLLKEVVTTFKDTPFIDAAGRQRSSSPVPLIDLKHLHGKEALLEDEKIIGGATSVHNESEAHVAMGVSANNDAVIRQTFQRLNYQSGNSHLIECTFSNIAPQTGVVKRVGYFNSNTTTPFASNYDGLYLESSSGTVKLCVAKSGTITQIEKDSWTDKLDGFGASGVTVDWTKSHIFFIDFLWLGVGRVRFGFNIGGLNIVVYEHQTSNIGSGVYMSSPNHSIRYEIRSTGGAGTFNQICSTVRTEGDGGTLGISTTLDTHIASTNYASVGTQYATVGVRLKSTHTDISTELIYISMLCSSNDNFHWEILLNPTITGTFTYNDVTNSAFQYAVSTGTTTATGGYIIASGYSFQSTAVTIPVTSLVKLGASIDGVMDTMVLTVIPLSAGLSVYSSMSFQEKI
jgi:hypothetical protein